MKSTACCWLTRENGQAAVPGNSRHPQQEQAPGMSPPHFDPGTGLLDETGQRPLQLVDRSRRQEGYSASSSDTL